MLFEHVGCSKLDLKKFQRDLKAFIKDSDADMFIQNFTRKQKVNASFYVAYELDGDGRLKHFLGRRHIKKKLCIVWRYCLF